MDIQTLQPDRVRAVSFAFLFDLANKLQVLLDRELAAGGLTAKQWRLLLAIEQQQSGRENVSSISLSETAKAVGTSHQNARQLINKLMQRGFLEVRTSSSDTRRLEISITQKCRKFWQERASSDNMMLEKLFAPLSEERQVLLAESLQQLLTHSAHLMDAGLTNHKEFLRDSKNTGNTKETD